MPVLDGAIAGSMVKCVGHGSIPVSDMIRMNSNASQFQHTPLRGVQTETQISVRFDIYMYLMKLY